MIARFLLSLAAAAQAGSPALTGVDGTPLSALPKQAMPASGCAAFLWSAAGSRSLVAMAGSDPALLRVAFAGKVADLARTGQHDSGGFGFAGSTEYRSGDAVATLDMTIAPRDSLKDGAAIPQATLRIDRSGQDSVVLPVAGLIGCVSALMTKP